MSLLIGPVYFVVVEFAVVVGSLLPTYLVSVVEGLDCLALRDQGGGRECRSIHFQEQPNK